MKKVLLVAVALTLAFTAKAFAEDAKAKATTDTKPAAVATTPAKAEPAKAPAKAEPAKTEAAKPTASTTPAKNETPKATAANTKADAALNGNITKLDAANLSLKDNAGKEWTFKYDSKISLKEYKVGDKVEVKYEKDNLKSIAKATK